MKRRVKTGIRTGIRTSTRTNISTKSSTRTNTRTNTEEEVDQGVEEVEALAEEIEVAQKGVTTPEEEDGVDSETTARRNTYGRR